MKTTKLLCKTGMSLQLVSLSRSTASRPWAQAMLDVLQRRGHAYGLLAHYEESRLNSSR